MLKLCFVIKTFGEDVGTLIIGVAVSRLQPITVPVKNFVEPLDRRVVSAVQMSNFFRLASCDHLKRRLIVLPELQ